MSHLEDFVDSALKAYFDTLNKKPQKGEEDDLLKFYNDQSKLTRGDKKLGAKNIVETLRKDDREFHLDKYTCGSYDDNTLIINCSCIVGNSRVPIMLTLESQPSADGESKIYIINQIMNL